MALELIKKRGLEIIPPEWLKGYQVKSVDASVVTEPGSTGTDWRLYYSINLFSLKCDQFIITRPKVGESLLNFDVKENDLFIGDKAYGRLKGLQYITSKGGNYIVGLHGGAFSMFKNDKNLLW